MAELIYLLCALTSIGCASLLVRGYQRTRAGLLAWSAACFVGLALNNLLLFVDLAILPSIDLSVLRNIITLISVLLLLYGLIWKTE